MEDSVETAIELEQTCYNFAKKETPDAIVFVPRQDVDYGYVTYGSDARLVATVLTSQDAFTGYDERQGRAWIADASGEEGSPVADLRRRGYRVVFLYEYEDTLADGV